jgi:hypothetical protein
MYLMARVEGSKRGLYESDFEGKLLNQLITDKSLDYVLFSPDKNLKLMLANNGYSVVKTDKSGTYTLGSYFQNGIPLKWLPDSDRYLTFISTSPFLPIPTQIILNSVSDPKQKKTLIIGWSFPKILDDKIIYQDELSIIICDLDFSNRRNILSANASSIDFHSIFPQGGNFYYMKNDYKIYSSEPDGTNEKVVVSNDVSYNGFSFLKDRETCVYISKENGTLVAENINTGAKQTLGVITPNDRPYLGLQLNVSPDEDNVAVNVKDGVQIFKTDGSGSTLIGTSVRAEFLSWK